MKFRISHPTPNLHDRWIPSDVNQVLFLSSWWWHQAGRWVDVRARAGQLLCGPSRCLRVKHSKLQGTRQKQLNLWNHVPRGMAPRAQKANTHTCGCTLKLHGVVHGDRGHMPFNPFIATSMIYLPSWATARRALLKTQNIPSGAFISALHAAP